MIKTTLFNSFRLGRGANLPRVCVRKHMGFYVTFPHFECERGNKTFDHKKINVFEGTQKAGRICCKFFVVVGNPGLR